MKLLEGKTALITGAARGIGKALAVKFASEGANIAFTDLVIDENAKQTEEEIAAFRDTHKQIEKTFALVDMEKYPVEYYLDNGCNYAVVEFVEELPSETVYLKPGNEGEKALAKKAGISAYSATKRHFCFR